MWRVCDSQAGLDRTRMSDTPLKSPKVYPEQQVGCRVFIFIQRCWQVIILSYKLNDYILR